MKTGIISTALRVAQRVKLIENFAIEEIFHLPKRLTISKYMGEYFVEYHRTLITITPNGWKKYHETKDNSQSDPGVERGF